jgi:plasmid stabilization system protein ParE
VTARAEGDIARAADWLAKRNPAAARAFRAMALKAILRLSDAAEAHPLAPEAAALGRPVRRALFGRATRWRLYFLADADRVVVLHIRHGARSDWRA